MTKAKTKTLTYGWSWKYASLENKEWESLKSKEVEVDGFVGREVRKGGFQ